MVVARGCEIVARGFGIERARTRWPMAKRRIQDERGVTWDIWDVLPREVFGPAYDRRSGDRLRSLTPESNPVLQPELEEGWLCFQASDERRRLAPIPADWCDVSDGVLRVLVEIAKPVARTTDARPTPSPVE
jgi:hypothetical protein